MDGHGLALDLNRYHQLDNQRLFNNLSCEPAYVGTCCIVLNIPRKCERKLEIRVQSSTEKNNKIHAIEEVKET